MSLSSFTRSLIEGCRQPFSSTGIGIFALQRSKIDVERAKEEAEKHLNKSNIIDACEFLEANITDVNSYHEALSRLEKSINSQQEE